MSPDELAIRQRAANGETMIPYDMRNVLRWLDDSRAEVRTLTERLAERDTAISRVAAVLGPESYRSEFRQVLVGEIRTALAGVGQPEPKPHTCTTSAGSPTCEGCGVGQ